MAVDMFLKINGIDGESRDHKHKGEIEILSWSWGLTQATSTGGGAGAGKVQPKEFIIVKEIDKASPKLMEACCTGEHLHDATLTLVNKETQLEYLKIKMSDVLISSYQTGGANTGGAVPMDQVSFSFSQVNVQTTDKRGSFNDVTCNFASDIIFKEQGHNH